MAFPPGDAHQLVNDGTEPLVYVGLSAVAGADVCLYPDSKKVSAAAGTFPNARRWIFREGDFDGEPG